MQDEKANQCFVLKFVLASGDASDVSGFHDNSFRHEVRRLSAAKLFGTQSNTWDASYKLAPAKGFTRGRVGDLEKGRIYDRTRERLYKKSKSRSEERSVGKES